MMASKNQHASFRNPGAELKVSPPNQLIARFFDSEKA